MWLAVGPAGRVVIDGGRNVRHMDQDLVEGEQADALCWGIQPLQPLRPRKKES